MTELLYVHDSYVKEFDACVKEVSGKQVFLDRSYFYPASGGQPCDIGKIFATDSVYEVQDVRKIDGVYTITVDKEGLQQGAIVKCRLDWDRRYALMRIHTATHILSSILYHAYNAKITGNQLGLDKSRMDCDAPITKADLPKLEEQLNSEIEKNHQVEIKFYKRKELENIEELNRLAKGIPETLEIVRVVRIGEIDMQFDGGTHVKETKEIGKVKLLDIENRGKSNKRIYFSLEAVHGNEQH